MYGEEYFNRKRLIYHLHLFSSFPSAFRRMLRKCPIDIQIDEVRHRKPRFTLIFPNSMIFYNPSDKTHNYCQHSYLIIEPDYDQIVYCPFNKIEISIFSFEDYDVNCFLFYHENKLVCQFKDITTNSYVMKNMDRYTNIGSSYCHDKYMPSLTKELMENRFHPRNLDNFVDWGFEEKD